MAKDTELTERLELIESMIAEGRRSTESWGWTFVLWGVAYYVAILWAGLGHSYLAWPVTMIAAGVLTGVFIARKRSRGPATTANRAIGAIWWAVGISMFILLMSLGFSGIADQHSSIAVAAAMLATANAASSFILKWKLQFACVLVWWALTVYACFGGGNMLTIAFLTAIFFCQIVFGSYGMICESRRRRQVQGAANA
ncbi:MAG: hypothetical protein WCF30_16260 [Terracidiphilus sp.]